MRIQAFHALLPKNGALTEADFHFAALRESFTAKWKQGIFTEAPQKAIYLYRIQKGQSSHLGVLAAVSIEDYLDGAILEHEHILPARGKVQEQLLKRHQASIKPVLLAYPSNARIGAILNRYIEKRKALLDLQLEGARHEVWVLEDTAEINGLKSAFQEGVPKAYIADGHHRTTCVATLYREHARRGGPNPYAWLYCALFPVDQLEVHDFNRVLSLAKPEQVEVLWGAIRTCAKLFPLTGPERPEGKHQLSFFHGGSWYRMAWKADFLQACRERDIRLDCQILDEVLLEKAFPGGAGYALRYLAGPLGPGGLQSEVGNDPLSFGFCLFPIPFEEIMSLADAGRALPAKSTWFEPRMKTGLVSMKL